MSRHAHDPPPYLAHSANDNGAGVAEPLAFHLRSVAERAAEFAAAFGAAEQARAAGLLHDLGKYARRFQQHLYHPRQRAGDHWSAGAVLLAWTLGTDSGTRRSRPSHWAFGAATCEPAKEMG